MKLLYNKNHNEKNITLGQLVNFSKLIRADFLKQLKDKKIDEKFFGAMDIRFKGLMSFLSWGSTYFMSFMNLPIAYRSIYESSDKREIVKQELTKLITDLRDFETDTYKQFSAIYQFVKAVYANDGKNFAWKEMVDCIKNVEGK